MATVICMEMMLVLVEDEEATDVGGIKCGVQRRRDHCGKKMRVVALHTSVSSCRTLQD